MPALPISIRRPFDSLRIQTRFLLIVLVLGGSFCGYLVISAVQQERADRVAAEQSTLNVARALSGRLDDYLQQMDTLIGVLAPAMLLTPSDLPHNDMLLRKARSSFPDFVNNVAVWDVEGRNVGSLDPSVEGKSFNVRDRKYFQLALKTDGMAIEAPAVSRSNGEFVAIFARKIKDGEGRAVGVISASTQLRHTQQLIDIGANLPDGSLISIIDADGVVLARSLDPEHWIGRSLADLPTYKDKIGLVEGSGERVGIDQVLRVSAFSTARRVPWRVFVGIRSEDVFGPAREHFVTTLSLGLALSICSALAAILFARSVATPLSRLMNDADRFGVGDLDYQSTVTGSPEVARLSESMNRMARSLKERSLAVVRSERHLLAITDNLPALIAYIDSDQRYRFINAASGRTLNTRPQDVIGRTMAEVRGALYPSLEPHVLKVLSGQPVTFEGAAHVGGQLTFYQSSYVPDLTPTGEVAGFYAMTFDISKQKYAEMALAKEKEGFQLMTDNVPALIAYIDLEHRFQFANQVHKDWFGRDPASLIGTSILALHREVRAVQSGPALGDALRGRRVEYQSQVQTAQGPRDLQVVALPDLDQLNRVRGCYVLASDITEIKQAQLMREQSDERLRTITDNLPALVCYIDATHTFRFNNKTYERWLRKPLTEITGHRVADVYSEGLYTKLAPSIEEGLAGAKVRFEVDFPGRDGIPRYARGTYIPDRRSDGSVAGVYGLVDDVTTLKLAELKLWNLAQFDTLTQLANRSNFNQRLKEAIDIAAEAKHEMAVLFLDIDKFKQINDRLGHQAGDKFLVEFAKRLKRAVRPSDTVGRLGGDEFVILLATLHRGEEAQFVARKILHAMAAPFIFGEEQQAVSTSIGIAIRRAGEIEPAQLLRRADEALYAAKAAGRNTFKMIA